MGGKSQQRVAGNVKPANSRRARELLINKQHNISNIITFGALSNSNNVNSVPTLTGGNVDGREKEDQDSGKKVASILKSRTSSPAVDESKPKLVVKKIGGRDCFSRVTFSSDTNFSTNEVVPRKCGVFLPPSDLLDISTNKLREEYHEYADQQEKDEAKESNNNEDEDNSEGLDSNDDIDDNVSSETNPLDFDTILQRVEDLNEKQESIAHVSSITELGEEQLDHEFALLDLLKLMVRNFYKELSIVEWDLVVSSLQKWIKWSVAILTNHDLKVGNKQLKLIRRTLRFTNQLIELANQLQTNKDTDECDDFPMMEAILDDWDNFYSSPIFQSLIVLYFKTLKTSHEVIDEEKVNLIRHFIKEMSRVIISVDHKSIISSFEIQNQLDIKDSFDPGYKLPTRSVHCEIDEKKFGSFIGICRLLSNNSREVIIVAHSMLKKSIKGVCEASSITTLASDDLNTIEDVPIFPPISLMSTLTFRDSMMTALLSDYKEGDISVTIEPKSDSYACTLSYLYIWDLIIDYTVGVGKELSCRIIHSLKKLGLIQRLLDNIVVLFPPLTERNLLNLRYKKTQEGHCKKLVEHWTLAGYLKQPLATTIVRPLNEIELTAIHLYFSIALHMPVTVRKWHNNNPNKRLCNLVNEYTVKHISPIICSIEMESVQAKCRERASLIELDNLIIKARPSAKEVYAIYTRDEFKMELTIKLPLNYPLGPVQIDGGKRVGVTDVKWRSWLLQLTTFLSHQNGPILDGVDLWRRNIDKRFEGVEKCTICFSILHSNYQLPKKKCQTCANMFHNMCLYKWFESSGNSTCPLCRNPW